MHKTIALKPRLSEKTYGLSENRVYVVDVPKDVNKHTIARAAEAQFEVKVAKVNTTNVKGKTKRVISISGKRAAGGTGRRSDIKKAYITLAEGHSLPFFAAVEEEEQKEEALQEKVDKAAAKQADKESKPKRNLSLRGRRGKKEEDE
jgi:large subunit ribosomal protein L23